MSQIQDKQEYPRDIKDIRKVASDEGAEADDYLLVSDDEEAPPYELVTLSSAPTKKGALEYPGAVALEENGAKAHQFQSSMYGCLDSPCLSLGACFCTPFVFGRGTDLLCREVDQPIPPSDSLRSWLTPACGLYYLGSILTSGLSSVFLGCSRRGEVRRKYGIPGSGFRDLTAHACCHPCALVQEHREIHLRETQARQLYAQEQEFLVDELQI